MSDQTQVAEGTVAAEAGNLKRSLQMRWFNSRKITAEVMGGEKERALGQVVGSIYDVKEKVGTLPNGEPKMSLIAIGDFEAVNYATGEVITSTAAYLPAYYLETVKTILDKSEQGAVLVAVEIVLVPTGKNIPVAYEVKNLMRRQADNPIDRIKRELAAANRLRLPPPPENRPAVEGEVRQIEMLPQASDPPEPSDLVEGEADDPVIQEAALAEAAKTSRRASARAPA